MRARAACASCAAACVLSRVVRVWEALGLADARDGTGDPVS